MNIITVAYYTDDDYKLEMLNLQESLVHYRVMHLLREIESCSWHKAVRYKPTFIRDCLRDFSEADGILYLDADAVVRRPLPMNDFKDCHFAAVWFRRNRHAKEEILTGTMFFANTPTTMSMVEQWVELTPQFRHSETPEQDALKVVWEQNQERLITKILHPGWCYIFDDFKTLYPDMIPIVEHFQASRKYKRKKGHRVR